jgi:uncharacterized RDD family membrane protein YckC
MSHRAGFWIRLVATLIDFAVAVLLGIAASVVMVIIWDRVGGRARAERIAQFILYSSFLLYTTLEIFVAGTLGKLLLGLRITQQDGHAADVWRRILRWSTKQFWLLATMLFLMSGLRVFYAISGLSSLVVAVGCLYASNDDHLTWHDQWAGTAVYKVAPKRAGEPRRH